MRIGPESGYFQICVFQRKRSSHAGRPREILLFPDPSATNRRFLLRTAGIRPFLRMGTRNRVGPFLYWTGAGRGRTHRCLWLPPHRPALFESQHAPGNPSHRRRDPGPVMSLHDPAETFPFVGSSPGALHRITEFMRGRSPLVSLILPLGLAVAMAFLDRTTT